jgi:hypothetical protein
VLVEESRLSELIKLDEALQKEQALIGKQCSTIVQDYQFPARVPIPATRYAIHQLCEEQMSRARSEIMKLQSEWLKFAKQNHYNKPHLFIKNSYVNSAPFGQKALKLRLVKEATETWALRKERDTMLYEDDLSFLTCLYYDAKQRQRDYERYYILATRYGPYTDEEFYFDAFPGKRYYRKVTQSTIKIQLAWDRYWAVMKLRRYRAARMIQKYWRRYITYKQLHPIIKLRLKIGKKTYYRFCFALWKEYIALVRRIRGLMEFQLSNSVQICFNAWKKSIRDAKDDRAKAIERFSKRFKNLALYGTFCQWTAYTKRNKFLRMKLRRLFAFPHFDMWLEYATWSKHVKKVNNAATLIQCMTRRWKAKRRYRKRTKARLLVFNFSLILISRIKIRQKRQKLLLTEYYQWKPDELNRRILKLNEIERQRLQKKQLFIQDKEKAFLNEMKKHLNSHNGMEQLRLMVEDFMRKKNKNKKIVLSSDRDSASSMSSPNRSMAPLLTHRSLETAEEGDKGGEMMTGNLSKAPSFAPQFLRQGSASAASGLTMETGGAFQLSQENEDALLPSNKGFLSWIPFLNSSGTRDQYHQKLDLMVKKMKKSCSKMVRLIEGFNYDVKYPPFIRCYHPACMNCFTNEEQYHRHIQLSDSNPYHKLEKEILSVEQKRVSEELIASLEKELAEYRWKPNFDKFLRTDDETLGLHTNKKKKAIDSKNHKKPVEKQPQFEVSSVSSVGSQETSAEEELSTRDFIHCKQLEEKLHYLKKFSACHSTTHFHNLLKNIKGLDIFRNFYLKQYGLTKVINLLDCYLAVQEWKKFNLYQAQYYTKAVNIYEMFLQFSLQNRHHKHDGAADHIDSDGENDGDEAHIGAGNTTIVVPGLGMYEALRPLDFIPTYVQQKGNSLLTMITKLSQLKEEEINQFPGFYHETNKKLSTMQSLLHQKPSKYLEWTTSKLLLPTIFQDLELLLFQQLYSYYYKDKEFFMSNEFLNYLKILDDEQVQKNNELFKDYKHYRMNFISNWSISFKKYEQMIAHKADEALEIVIKSLIDEIYLPIERQTVQERKVEKRHEEQSHYERTMLFIDEGIHWTADDTADYVFDFYVDALLRSMWEIPEYRKGMMQYSGMAKFKLKKKNDVMANYEKMKSNKDKEKENKEWFTNFFSSTSTKEKSLLPKEAMVHSKRYSIKGKNTELERENSESFHDNAVTVIQKRMRGFIDRKKARIEFAKTFKKFYDSSAQKHYYFNTTTQESSWQPPSLFKKLYPNAKNW